MNVVTFISNLIIPVLIFYVIGYGLLNKVDIFDAFTRGAADGFKVVFNILPTLIGLMMAIGLLRASGALEVLGEFLSPYMKYLHFPAELVPLSLIKMFSSSAATGLLTDIYKNFGTDSNTGFMASLLMCCSETIFYTISVYFMATGDKEHKPVTGMNWMLAGALICTFAGMAACVVITRFLGI
ncbi:MAG: spore maturation protein [Lachnospiraceae bacterium]|nr:spore maturation protein [Lachnospiraceae bacterium]